MTARFHTDDSCKAGQIQFVFMIQMGVSDEDHLINRLVLTVVVFVIC